MTIDGHALPDKHKIELSCAEMLMEKNIGECISIAALESENARLRAALQRIADGDYDCGCSYCEAEHIARQALEATK